MTIPIMVVTPNPGFGELICQILEEAGGYSLALTTTREEAISASAEINPAICIVDGDLKEEAVNLVNGIRSLLENVLVVFIPQQETTKEEEEEVNADGYLAKPFYLPDLVTTVEEVVEKVKRTDSVNLGKIKDEVQLENQVELMVGEEVKAPEKLPLDGPGWLTDVDLAAQYLARLSLESASQASLITHEGKIWAYAGELPQPAVQELADTVAKFYSADSKSDLARFIHLEATGGEYMLYATGIKNSFVLALVFSAEMPFSKIRTQANNLASALSEEPRSDEMLNLDGGGEVESGFDQKDMGIDEDFSDMPLLDDVPPPIPTDWIPTQEVSEGRKGFLEELMETDVLVDSPIAENFTLEPREELDEVVPDPILTMDDEEYGTLPSTVQNDRLSVEDESIAIGETLVSASLRPENVANEAGETIPSEAQLESKAFKLEPVSPSVYNLTYACVLIPRIPDHHLTGNLASNLSEWITQLSIAFGWRLEHLSIRPEYLQWLINVPPSTSPGYLMRIIRQHTSRRMFVEYPKMIDENPSGDFWAPGYLIMSGSQPLPPQLVKDFIKDTRRRQGIKR